MWGLASPVASADALGTAAAQGSVLDWYATLLPEFDRSNMGMMLITHYQRILNHLKPHFVHIMAKGKIIKSGDHTLALDVEKNGYEKFLKA